jgi:predicted transcriptional regulator
MSESTSVRLSQRTRDAVNKLAAEQGLTADRAIAVAVASFREEEWRRQAEQEMREMANDPVDRALVAETMRFLDDE